MAVSRSPFRKAGGLAHAETKSSERQTVSSALKHPLDKTDTPILASQRRGTHKGEDLKQSPCVRIAQCDATNTTNLAFATLMFIWAIADVRLCSRSHVSELQSGHELPKPQELFLQSLTKTMAPTCIGLIRVPSKRKPLQPQTPQ